MLELEKRMQEEPFDVEVQACDPDDCRHDCLTGKRKIASTLTFLGGCFAAT
ncbi:hypothetical protein HFM87_13965, partial [Blautia producta]|nr:hypothetical protein [Blautia producta]NSG16963.1 hypothetical protein [Blautia producta]NSJ77162.1 hypothetical protein [Blautia producta]